jgi:hypothetical protein
MEFILPYQIVLSCALRSVGLYFFLFSPHFFSTQAMGTVDVLNGGMLYAPPTGDLLSL